jgi:hypothetical protein
MSLRAALAGSSSHEHRARAHLTRAGRLMFARNKPKPTPRRHRGRVWLEDGYWRYACYDCDYGAGASVSHSAVAVAWLVSEATKHAKTGPR